MMRLFFVRFSSIILNYIYLKMFPAKSKIPYFLELIFLVVKIFEMIFAINLNGLVFKSKTV